MTKITDAWTSGSAYEAYMGRWSRLVASQFLAWLAPRPECRWLDVGCGSGALSAAILAEAFPGAVRAIDRSDAYIDHARTALRDGRVSFGVGNATALPVDLDSFDFVVSGLVLNFVPNSLLAVREMVRATKPGGTIAAYVWDYAGEMQFLRRFWDVAIELDPSAADLHEGRRFPLCTERAMGDLFRHVDLEDVQVRAVDISTRFNNFEDFWAPFLSGQGPAPGYVMALAPEARSALEQRLRKTLPTLPDGSIPLIARAWAVRGFRRHGREPAVQ